MTDQEFLEMIDRTERIEDALNSIGKIKADKNTIKTKIGNAAIDTLTKTRTEEGKSLARQLPPELVLHPSACPSDSTGSFRKASSAPPFPSASASAPPQG